MCFFFFKQKTAYEMRISDWSSDVCSSDLCSPAAMTAMRLRIDSAAASCAAAATALALRRLPAKAVLSRSMAESAEPFGDGSTRWVPGASWRREAGDRLGPPAASCRGLAGIAPSARARTSATYLPIGKGSTSAPRDTPTSTGDDEQHQKSGR